MPYLCFGFLPGQTLFLYYISLVDINSNLLRPSDNLMSIESFTLLTEFVQM